MDSDLTDVIPVGRQQLELGGCVDYRNGAGVTAPQAVMLRTRAWIPRIYINPQWVWQSNYKGQKSGIARTGCPARTALWGSSQFNERFCLNDYWVQKLRKIPDTPLGPSHVHMYTCQHTYATDIYTWKQCLSQAIMLEIKKNRAGSSKEGSPRQKDK